MSDIQRDAQLETHGLTRTLSLISLFAAVQLQFGLKDCQGEFFLPALSLDALVQFQSSGCAIC